MRPVLKTIFIATTSLMVACDPGMSIRQVDLQKQAASGNAEFSTQVIVQVEKVDRLIGSTSYPAKVEVTNASGTPMTIFSVELAAQNKLYANKAPEVVYPLPIQPGDAKVLGVYFRLDDDVQNTFQEGADLLVHYQSGGKEGVAVARLTSGRL